VTVNHSHYVGLVVPHCSLTYSTPPCRAQLPAQDFTMQAIEFNGEYATRGAGLTSAADSKLLTFSGFFRINATGLINTLFGGWTTVGGNTERVVMHVFNDNFFYVDGFNAAGTKIVTLKTNTAIQANCWYSLLGSFDLSDTSKRHLYLNDVNDLGISLYTNDTIDFTLADWSYGARGNGSSKFGGAIGEFYFNPGVYIDFSVTANRRTFVNANKQPKGIGGDGSGPTGSPSKVFFYSGGGIVNGGNGGTFTTAGAGTEAVADFATGTEKCFNSLGTCQDIGDFTDSPVTLYFGEDVTPSIGFVGHTLFGQYPFPFIKSIDYQSAIVSLGDDMGQRGSVTITLRDARHTDLPTTSFDKYRTDRGYDPLAFGTFWGRFKARNPYMRFQTLLLFVTQRDRDGNDFNVETRVYAVESISGPDGGSGEVRITAKDILKIADGDFAKAPVQSPGFLSADITAVATTATMAPSGAIADYPSSGYICIGGSEIVSYSKTGGDTFSMTRAQLGTVAATHAAQDRLQLVLRYAGISPDVIIADLLTTYAGVNPGSIDTGAWAAEVSGYLATVNTLTITEPTNVRDLVSEIILQIGGAIWWDDVNEQIRFQILRGIDTNAELWNYDNIIYDSLRVVEQESKRVTEVSVYFAQLNPTLKVDETRNYASVATVNDPTIEGLVGGKSIKTIFARGIPSGGRSVAQRVAEKYLSRYIIPPRRFNLELMKYSGAHPALGGGYLLGGNTLQNRIPLAWNADGPFQDADGNRVEVPIQVTRVNPIGFKWQVEAEEMLFTAFGADVDPTNHTVIFDVSRNDVNLQTVHDGIFAPAVSGDTVNCYINTGVIIGSSSTASPAFTVGTFAGGVTVNIIINGRIQGHGGNGGTFVSGAPTNGLAGGTAMYTRRAVNVTNNSQIWGGGGGGGSARGSGGGGTFLNGGGGGCGTDFGLGGLATGFVSGTAYFNNGNPGTSEGGGTAPFSPAGGNGGGPGLAGSNSTGGSFNSSGGAAGAAVDGTSFVTYAVAGDRRGGLIN
jgi:Phage tail fibre adhesin Gp38